MSELDELRSRLAALEDIEAIRQVKYDYFRCLDLKIWDELGNCFAEDIFANYGREAWTVEGRENLVAWLRSNEGGDGYQVSHAGHNPQVKLLGATEARGFFKLHDWVIIEPSTSYRGFGHYTDLFTKDADGVWRIQRLELSYDYKEERLSYIGNEAPKLTPAMES